MSAVATPVVGIEPVLEPPSDHKPDTLHLVCCVDDRDHVRPLIAFCGTDVSDEPLSYEGDPCVVCCDIAQVDGEHAVCPRNGKRCAP